MSYGNYNEPVKYEPPQQSSRAVNFKPWLIGCGACLLLAIFVIIMTSISIYRSAELIGETLGNKPQKGMKTGQQLAWRDLGYSTGNFLVIGNHMRSLDADGDGSRELIFFDPYQGQAEIVALDGSVLQKLAWKKDMENDNVLFWDFNGDGKDDVVHFNDDYNDEHTYITGLDMQRMHEFPGLIPALHSAVADTDGNGDAELLLISPQDDTFTLVDQGGKTLLRGDNAREYSEGSISSRQPFLLADMDGDGVYSVLYGEGFGKHIRNADGSGDILHIPVDPPLVYSIEFDYCLDINGDGCTELLCEYEPVFYDNAARKAFAYELPGGDYRLKWNSRLMAGSMDSDGDGQAELWVVPSGDMGTELLAIDARGNTVYHESLGCFCGGIETIEYKGQKYLVVCAMDRVLVYP